MKKALLTLALAVAGLSALSAHAAPVISFGGTSTAGFDNSGLTSTRINGGTGNNNVVFGSGFFIETFDAATQMKDAQGNLLFPPLLSGDANQPAGITLSNGCSFNSYNALGGAAGVQVTQGSFEARTGSTTNLAEQPKNDSTCYGVSPRSGMPAPASMLINWGNLITSPGDYINYLGIYYGSIDTYNNLYFYSDDAGTQLVATVTGQSILTALGGPSGSTTDDRSNVYVNLDFGPAEGFRSFRFETTGIAVEVDNIVLGLASREVPEPASLALVGAALAGLGFAGRRRKTAKV